MLERGRPGKRGVRQKTRTSELVGKENSVSEGARAGVSKGKENGASENASGRVSRGKKVVLARERAKENNVSGVCERTVLARSAQESDVSRRRVSKRNRRMLAMERASKEENGVSQNARADELVEKKGVDKSVKRENINVRGLARAV
jgi:hypothetical protein